MSNIGPITTPVTDPALIDAVIGPTTGPVVDPSQLSHVESLLPPNATAGMRAIEQAAARRLAAIDTPVATLWSPATCPAALLPWLAWAFAVDVWDSAWPEATKRSVIAASLEVHRRKGTRGALVLKRPEVLQARVASALRDDG